MSGWAYLLVLLGAFALRGIYLGEWHATPLGEVPIGDARAYDVWAQEIAAGDWVGREVFYQAPLYPYLVASGYAIWGRDLLALRLVQIALGSLTCALLARLGTRLFGARVGLAAGALLAVYAPALYYDGLMQKAVLDALLVTLSLLLLVEFDARRKLGWLVGAGLALGALALSRENALVLIPLALAWLGVRSRGEPMARRLVLAAALLGGSAALLVPVGARNLAVGGSFLLTTAQLGPNFWIGNHAGATGAYVPLRSGGGSARYERDDARELAEQVVGRPLDAAEVSRFWLTRALAWARENPGAFAGLLAKKAWLVWQAHEIADTDSFEAYADASTLLRTLARVFHFGVLVPLAVLGVVLTARAWRRLWLLHATILALAGSVALFFVLGRYRYPLVPLLALLAGAGLVEGARALRAADWRALAPGVAAALAAAIVSGWPPAPAPDSRAVTHYMLGLGLSDLGRFAEAEQALARALELVPEFGPAEIALGDALRREGRLADAVPHLESGVQLDPENPDAHNSLAAVLAEGGRPQDAEWHLRRALELRPDLADAHNNLANLLAARGELNEAIAHYERALAENRTSSDARYNLGAALQASGDLERALASYDDALAVDPRHAYARLARARLLAARGRPGEAALDYARVAEPAASAPPELVAQALREWAWLVATCEEPGVRAGPESVTLAEAAARLAGDADAGLLDLLGAAYAAAGRYADAVDAAERALAAASQAGDSEHAHEIEQRLARYRAGEPWAVRCQ